MKNVKVIEVRGGGYRVQVKWLPGTDEVWETLRHEALFAARRDAERLAARIEAAGGKIDLAHWVWSPSRCSPVAALHAAPTARLETSPRPWSAEALAWAARPTLD